MTVATALALLTALFKAIPPLRKWWEEFMEAYFKKEVANMEEEHRVGIAETLLNHDQRILEKIIRSPLAGEPSGIDGTERRDSLPGVQ